MSHSTRTATLLKKLRGGEELPFYEQLVLTLQLSAPAILAQISSVLMQYIDASMVGRLGADASAAIGLVSTSTWLFHGVCIASATGFTVQVAHCYGAGDTKAARSILRQALVVGLGFSLVMLTLGASIAWRLPVWLGGNAALRADAYRYFLICALALPLMQLRFLSGGMLQCSGNMRLPGMVNVGACALDVLFNLLLIFPTRVVHVPGLTFTMPGFGLGVAGAALGTTLAEACAATVLLWCLLRHTPGMERHPEEKFAFSPAQLKKALTIALPVGFEQIVMCGAQVAATRIVAPLGTVAIAANSFAVTAESICYMPGYGIGSAATTLIGQGYGAGRKQLTKRLAWMTTGLGMAVMACMAVLMYIAAPGMIGLLTPDAEIRALGAAVLRIEVFAEPLYAASIVASGALRGAGDTLVPSCLSFASMWLVRLPLAMALAPQLGLHGVWIAMCLELCVRGTLFLIRLGRGRWLKLQEKPAAEQA